MRTAWRVVGVCLWTACAGTGEWSVETWGEDYIEQEIPSAAFADGCSVRYDAFVVSVASRELLDGNGDVVGALTPAEAYDLTVAGPVPMGSVEVPADHYSHVRVTVAAADATAAQVGVGVSLHADGTLMCADGEIRFDWSFDDATTYDCEPPDLTIPAGGSDGTQITVHGDHLWYDGLENADAALRGLAVLNADENADGEVTLDELAGVSVPALGYQVGQFSDVLTLREFISHLTRTVIHIDGEGECRVNF